MISCVIIDDIQNSVDLIANHMKNRSELALVNTFTNPLEAVQFLERNSVDIAFIDMEMPYLNGLELIESLRSKKGTDIPKFIFTTGHVEYALPCFEQGVRDYLVKPIGLKRFNMAIDRIINEPNGSRNPTNTNRQFFFAEVSGMKTKINFNDISHVEGLGNYVKIICGMEKYIIHKSMNSIGDILPPNDFIRIHKSYIVSIDRILNYKGSELTIKVDNNKIQIPVGAKFKDTLFKRLSI